MAQHENFSPLPSTETYFEPTLSSTSQSNPLRTIIIRFLVLFLISLSAIFLLSGPSLSASPERATTGAHHKVAPTGANPTLADVEQDNFFNPEEAQRPNALKINDKQSIEFDETLKSETTNIINQNKGQIRAETEFDMKAAEGGRKALPAERHMKMTLVQPISQTTSKDQTCVGVNAMVVLSLEAITSSLALLEAGADLLILFVDSNDPFADRMIKSSYPKSQYLINSLIPTLDSHYRFLNPITSRCSRFIFLQTNFHLKDSLYILQTPLDTYEALFSSSVTVGGDDLQLPDLAKHDLSDISLTTLSQFVFIFSAPLLALITPLNFAFYSGYCLEQILIYPILALLQNSGLLKPIPASYPLHSIHRAIVQYKPLFLVQASAPKEDTLCFVSYPLNPVEPSLEQIKPYLESLNSQDVQQHATVIINLPYIHQASSSLWNYYKQIMRLPSIFSVRLRIVHKKTVSSLSVYEAAYSYCYQHALIISSRHNIAFEPTFITQLTHLLNQKQHYYFVSHRENDSVVNLPQHISYTSQIREQALYYQALKPLQVFRADLFKMIYFWILKSEEISFYEAEASFIFPLIELTRAAFGRTKTPLFNVFVQSQTELQRAQVQNLKLYMEWDQIPSGHLLPLPYNCLSNQAFRRNASSLIPKIMHQVWIGNHPISQFRQMLQNSLRLQNPDFQFYLWKDENITFERFPYMHALVWRSLQYERHSERSYSAPISSLIRYEALYHHGGIYTDFKTEGLKSLDAFLKYPIFFIDMDYQRGHYMGPRNVGNGIMGAMKHSCHLKFVLTKLISQDNFDYDKTDFPKIVGGFVLRQALTDQELFTMAGYGFQLFSQKPGTGRPNLCSFQTAFTADQKVFKVRDYKSGENLNIGIPCKVYPQAYLNLYKALAGTWIGKKKDIN